VFNGIIKSIVFGFIVSWIAVFEGYDCIPTMDFVLTAIMYQ